MSLTTQLTIVLSDGATHTILHHSSESMLEYLMTIRCGQGRRRMHKVMCILHVRRSEVFGEGAPAN